MPSVGVAVPVVEAGFAWCSDKDHECYYLFKRRGNNIDFEVLARLSTKGVNSQNTVKKRAMSKTHL